MTDASVGRGVRIAAVVAVLFGLTTLVSGGAVLFGGEGTQRLAGKVVGFVLWFNFLSGTFYVAAGIGLIKSYRWAAFLAALISVAATVVLCLLFAHVLGGGAYEPRTIAAMSLRAAFWIGLAYAARSLMRSKG